MLSGILSEIAAGQYLEDAGIPIISSTVEDQLFRFDSKTDKNPDFIIEFPVGSGCRRILEVKSNQSVWNDKFFRMIIPKHWWSYGQSKSLVLWTSVDIETASVFIHGFNCACTDMQVGKIKFVRTCVPNFQLLRSVPLRQLTENNDDLLYEKEEQVA